MSVRGNPSKYCLFLREDLAAQGENIFSASQLYGMKSDMFMYGLLREELARRNVSLETQLINKPEECEVILCLNETDFFLTYKRSRGNQLIVLILSEPPVYNAKDWNVARHRHFDVVLTFNDELLQNGPKYRKMIYPIDFPEGKIPPIPDVEAFRLKKHAALIASAFEITRPAAQMQSLLFERYRVLKWYAGNAPTQLDFFSRSDPWMRFRFFKGASLFNKVNPRMTDFVARSRFRQTIGSIHRGAVPGLEKNKVLSEYKFSFCFENSHNVSGYITEKIFDCFFSGTVPVYCGAPDVFRYIPANCYILYDDFRSIGALQNFLRSMDFERYAGYLENARKFLSSPLAEKFKTRNFIDTILETVRK